MILTMHAKWTVQKILQVQSERYLWCFDLLLHLFDFMQKKRKKKKRGINSHFKR